jgi:phosphoglycerol transferase
MEALSLFNLSALLVGTIGGFGALFSFLIWSQFRSYNRISLFIAFFSLFALLLVIEQWLRNRSASFHRWFGSLVLPLALLGIGLPDEIPKHFLPNRSVVETTFRQDREFIRRLEASVPPHSMIFQLPYVPFLGPAPPHMGQYGELKGYLHSKTLRWSGGAMINRETDRWIRDVSAKPVDQLIAGVATAGFAGIYIDRYGYSDGAVAIESQLRAVLETEPMISQDGRRSFFRFSPDLLSAIRERAAKGQSYADILRLRATAQVGKGCSPMEFTAELSWQWCGSEGEIVIHNPASERRTVDLQAVFATGYPDWSNLTLDGPYFSRRLKVNNIGTAFKASISARRGQSVLHLRSDAKPVDAPADPRRLVFRVTNLKWRESR